MPGVPPAPPSPPATGALAEAVRSLVADRLAREGRSSDVSLEVSPGSAWLVVVDGGSASAGVGSRRFRLDARPAEEQADAVLTTLDTGQITRPTSERALLWCEPA